MLQGALFLPESRWAPSGRFPDLVGRGAKEITIDTESKDPYLKSRGPGFIRGTAHIVGISVKADEFEEYYPIRHEGGGNLAPNVVIPWLKDQLESEGVLKIGANLPYDLEGLWKEGIDVKGPFYDVQIAEPLIDEGRFSYSLESLSQKYLGEGKEESLLYDAAMAYRIDPKGELYKLHSRFVGPYAIGDVKNPALIRQHQMKILDKECLWEVFDLESELMPIVLKMRLQGVKVNLDGAESLRDEFKETERKLHKSLKDLVGFHVSVWSSKKLVRAYASIGKTDIPLTRSRKPVPSITADWLKEQDDPVSKHVAAIRRYSKMRSDFIEGDVLEENVKGRIHAEFHQLRKDDKGVRYGRFSSCNPNLQQFPNRDEEFAGPMRGLFVADDGVLWGKGDYAQQEPVVGLHYATLMNLPGAKKIAEEYTRRFKEGPLDFHQMTADLSGKDRKGSKAINLGSMYVMGLVKTAMMLGKSLDETREFRKEYFKAIPYVQPLIDLCMRVASERGDVKTLLGRRLHFPLWEPADGPRGERSIPLTRQECEERYPGRPLRRAMTHKAINRIIQGSSADMFKKAMILIYRQEGAVPYLVVHDEWGGPCEDKAQAYRIKKTMEEAIPLCIPLRVDMSTGKSWGYTEKIS